MINKKKKKVIKEGKKSRVKLKKEDIQEVQCKGEIFVVVIAINCKSAVVGTKQKHIYLIVYVAIKDNCNHHLS